MNPSDWLTAPIFTLFQKEITLAQLLAAAFALAAAVFFYRRARLRWLPIYAERLGISAAERATLKSDLLLAFCLLAPAILVKTLGLPDEIRFSELASVGLSELLFLLGFIQVARFFDHFLGAVLPTFLPDNQSLASKTQAARFVAYTLGGLWLVSRTGHDFPLFSVGNYQFRVSNILAALLVLFTSQLVLFLLKRFALARLFRQNQFDAGAQFSINRLFSYVVYVLAAVLIFQSLGIEMTVVWGSCAALLVGAGLGLREAVNDFISGVILLFEKTVKVGDHIEVAGQTGVVRRIGFRTSLVETNDHTTVIVPNSRLFSDKVINFHGEDEVARFRVAVRVDFETDLEMVKILFFEAAMRQPQIEKEPLPKTRISGFFDHGIELELLFFTHDFQGVDDVRAQLRLEILEALRAANIQFGYEKAG